MKRSSNDPGTGRDRGLDVPAHSPVIPAHSPVIPAHSPVIPAQAGISKWRRGVNTFTCTGTTLVALILLLTPPAAALEYRGYFKAQATSVDFSDASLSRQASDDPAEDAALDLRLNLQQRAGAWRWHADYQLLARGGDRFELGTRNPALAPGGAARLDDARRVFDLSHEISTRDERVALHRLDRLYLGYSTEKTVISIGRQAVSWGNGLIYNPLDFFNPFDPAAVDTEYKTGDDMVYAQYLRDSGDDLQAVWVGRRDDDGEVTAEVASLAFKYHGFAAAGEYDLLLARHFDASIYALGGAVDHADAVWRGDLMVTRVDGDEFTSAVVNWSRSWVAWDRNVSATLEYFYNGFGIDDGDYGPAVLARRPELVARVARGELFTLGRNALAAAVAVELTPLWLLTTTLFVNLDDDSSLLQLSSRHDLRQDLQLLLALDLPTGDDGSEYGGIDSAVEDRTLGVDAALFAQLAWYF